MERGFREDLDGSGVVVFFSLMLERYLGLVWARCWSGEKGVGLDVAQEDVRRLQGGYKHLVPLGFVVEGIESLAFFEAIAV
jgi:hypothetical protein